MFILTIIILLGFNLLSIIPNHGIIGGEKIIYFISCGIVLLSSHSFKFVRKISKDVLYLIYGLSFLALFNFSLHGFHLGVFSSILAFFVGVQTLITIYEVLPSTKLLKYSLFTFCAINCIYTLFQTGFEPGGFMGSAPRLGNLICLTIICFWSINRYACIVLACFCVIIKEITGVGILIILINHALFYFMAFFALLGLHKEVSQSINIRIDAWKDCFPVYQTIKGCGFGVFPYIGKLERGFDNQVYSSVLKAFCGFGYGFILWLVTFFKTLKIDRYVVSLTLLCMVEYPLEIPKLWFTFIIVLAIYLIERLENDYSTMVR